MAKQIPVKIMSFKNKQQREIWKGTFFQAWMDRANCFSPSNWGRRRCLSSSSSQNWLKWRKEIQLGSAIVWKKIKVTITFSRQWIVARGKLNTFHIVWKLLKMSHLHFCIFGIFHQLLSYFLRRHVWYHCLTVSFRFSKTRHIYFVHSKYWMRLFPWFSNPAFWQYNRNQWTIMNYQKCLISMPKVTILVFKHCVMWTVFTFRYLFACHKNTNFMVHNKDFLCMRFACIVDKNCDLCLQNCFQIM